MQLLSAYIFSRNNRFLGLRFPRFPMTTTQFSDAWIPLESILEAQALR